MINLITNSKMKIFIFIVTLLFTSVVSYSQILESEWKFEKDFEKEFAGKYYIDDETSTMQIPSEIIRFPNMTKEVISERVKSFADYRVQFRTNKADKSRFPSSESIILVKEDSVIMLSESSPHIKSGKDLMMDNYVAYNYTYKIEVKDERIRVSVALVGSTNIVGGLESWPKTKYFKKHSRKALTFFHTYIMDLFKQTETWILNSDKKNSEW